MADAKKALTIEINADDKASAVFDKVGKKLKGLKKEAETEEGGGGGILGQLKGGFGRGSAFGQTAKILQGGGAVLGLSLAGKELDSFADKAIQLRKELHEGAKSGGEIAEELAKSIPVYGSIIDAGRKFRSLIDGTADAIESIAKENSFSKLLDQQSEAIKRIAQLRDQGDAEGRKLANAGELIGLRDPTATLTRLRQEREELAANVRLAQKNMTGELDAKYGGLAELQRRSSAEQQRVGDARAALAAAQAKLDKELALARANPQGHEYATKRQLQADVKNAQEELRQAESDAGSAQSGATARIAAREAERKQRIANLANVNVAIANKVKEEGVVEDAANQERQRRELEHWQTMNKIQTAAQVQALQDQSKTVAASIAQQLGDYRAIEAAAEQHFKEAFSEAMAGGPLSPAEVGAQAAEEAAGRRKALEESLRHTTAEGIGRGVLGAFDDAADFLKGKLTDWPQKLLYAAGLSGPANFNATATAASVRTAGAPREARFLTGAGSVENRTAQDQLAEQKKTNDLLKQLRHDIVVNVGDAPALVFN